MSKVAKFYHTQPEFVSCAFNPIFNRVFTRKVKISTHYTFAAVYDDESQQIRFGMAKCNVKDNFCKAIEREIATRNADDRPFYVINNFNGRRNDYADQVMKIMKDTEVKCLKREYPAFFNELNIIQPNDGFDI